MDAVKSLLKELRDNTPFWAVVEIRDFSYEITLYDCVGEFSKRTYLNECDVLEFLRGVIAYYKAS